MHNTRVRLDTEGTMIKTQSLRDDLKLAAAVSVALLAAAACESRPRDTESTTLAATPTAPAIANTANTATTPAAKPDTEARGPHRVRPHGGE